MNWMHQPYRYEDESDVLETPDEVAAVGAVESAATAGCKARRHRGSHHNCQYFS